MARPLPVSAVRLLRSAGMPAVTYVHAFVFRLHDTGDMAAEIPIKNPSSSKTLKYWEEYTSAERVRANFLSDVASPFGQDLAADMFMLGLTRFEDVKSEFLDLRP